MKYIIITMLCLSFLLCTKVTVDEQEDKKSRVSVPFSSAVLNPWDLYYFAPKTGYLIVTYSEKYGPVRTVECMAVFESSTMYRLIGRKVRKLDLIKLNIVSIEVRRMHEINADSTLP